MLPLCPSALPEPVVHKDSGRTGDPVLDSVDCFLAGLILIESEPEIVMHGAARLRPAAGVNILNGAGERIGRAGLIGLRAAKEGREIADGSKSQSAYQRVLRKINEFIQRALLESRALGQQLDRPAGLVRVLPVLRGHQNGRVLIARPYGQGGSRLVEHGGGISQTAAHRLAVVYDEFLERRTN